jgi:hypothetical protein
MRGARVVLAAGFATLSACSLLYASDLDHANTPGPGSNDGSPDAPPPPADTGAAETGSDALAPAKGCAAIAPPVKFCDDFDDGGALGAGWDTVNIDNPQSSVAFDTQAPFSPPRAVGVAFEAAPDCSYARLEKQFVNVGTQRQDVRLKIRPALPWNGDHVVLALVFNDSGTGGECQTLVYLYGDNRGVQGTHANVQVLPNNDDRALTAIPVGEVWSDLYVSATPADGGLAITYGFIVGGAPYETTYTYAQCKLGPKLSVDVGLHCGSASVATSYDDVQVDWQ